MMKETNPADCPDRARAEAVEERTGVAGEAEETNSFDPTPRRDFLKQVGLASTGMLVAPLLLLTDGGTSSVIAQTLAGGAGAAGSPETIPVRLKVNGANYGMRLDTRTTILDLLREQLDLTGTKKGCNHGQCGACTVIVNGERINSCLALAVCHDGAEVTTVEGLAKGQELHPLQAAFIKNDGFQCGYCTPGQICSAVAMLNEAKRNTASHVTPDVRQQGQIQLTDEEIRERMSGNLCRCGAYNGIVAAIREASGQSNTGASRAE